jgi:hypothetical protein
MTTITAITTHGEGDYLIIEGSGIIANAGDEKAFASHCYDQIQQHGSRRVLVDQRGIHFESSIVDQCAVVEHYTREFDPIIRAVRLAILVRPEDEDLHGFWELYASNRGYFWRVFTDMEAARAFLRVE